MRTLGYILIAAGLLLLFRPSDCRADGLWFTTAVRSYHVDRDAKYNEKNYGIGLEYQLNKNVAAVVGEYKNSFYNKSTYYGVLYTPFAAGPFKAGVLAGEINGYVLKEPRAYGLIAVPVVVWEGDRFGANAVFIPPVGNKTGVLGLQLKMKFQ